VTSRELYTAYSKKKQSPNGPHTRGNMSKQACTHPSLDGGVYGVYGARLKSDKNSHV